MENSDYVGMSIVDRTGMIKGEITDFDVSECEIEDCGNGMLEATWEDGDVTFVCPCGLDFINETTLKII